MSVHPDQSRARATRLATAVLALTVVLAIVTALLSARGGDGTAVGGRQPSSRVALAAADAAGCPDVEAIFARGTGELPGLGIMGEPFTQALAAALPGSRVRATAVDYAADISQAGAGPGSADLTQKLAATAERCAGTRFVIGGYSQGATVTDLALGIRVGAARGTPLPADLLDRVAAVVVFGNPLGLAGTTIGEANPAVADRTVEFCNDRDVVCTGRGGLVAHLAYRTNGDTADGARFAAGRIAGSAGSGAVDAAAARAAARAAAADGATARARLGATRMLAGGRAGDGPLSRLLAARRNR
jgi:cutinase